MILVKYVTLQTCLKALNEAYKEQLTNDIDYLLKMIDEHFYRKSHTNEYNIRKLHSLLGKIARTTQLSGDTREIAYELLDQLEPLWQQVCKKLNALHREKYSKVKRNYKPNPSKQRSYDQI